MNSPNQPLDTTSLFAVLNSETRQRILRLLATNGEMCVCEVVDVLGIGQPSVSKAFGTLKSGGLVIDRREANWTWYRLSPDQPPWVAQVMQATLDQLGTSALCRRDQAGFEALRLEKPRAEACADPAADQRARRQP